MNSKQDIGNVDRISAVESPKPEQNGAGEMVSSSAGGAHKEPPIFYHPACGTLCNILWWARTSTPAKSGGADQS